MSECPGAEPVQSMSPNFGGIQGFYNIAKGISDSLQKLPTDKMYRDLKNAIFANSEGDTKAAVENMVKDQSGPMIFWSLGILFILLALILIVTSIILQCCCACFKPKPKELKKRKTCGFILLGFLVICLVFLMTGVILYNMAQADLSTGIADGDKYTDTLSGDLSRVLTKGNAQIKCELQKTTDTMFDDLKNQMKSYAKTVIDGTKKQTGFQALHDFDSAAYNQQLDDTINKGQALWDILSRTTGSSQCSQMIPIFTNKIGQSIKLNLQAFQGIATVVSGEMSKASEKFDEVQRDVQTHADSAANQMGTTQIDIKSSLDSMDTMIGDLDRDMSTVIDEVKTGRKEFEPTYDSISSVLIIFVNIPATIIIVFLIITIILIILKTTIGKSLGKCGNLIVIIGFYITVILSMLLILISSLAFIGGWGVSSICVPIFEDSTNRLFNLIEFATPEFDGKKGPVVNAGKAMDVCSSESGTVFGAIGGQSFLSLKSINEKLDLNSYKSQAEQKIKASIPPIFSVPTNTLHTQLTSVEGDFTALKDQDLKSACNVDPSEYLTALEISVQQSRGYLGLIDALNDNVGRAKEITVGLNAAEFDKAQGIIETSVKKLINNLETIDFKCRPIVQIYHNLGHVICQQFGQPIHGLWAAIGLTGLVAFFAAIPLLLAYRWLKTPEPDSDNEKDKEKEKEKEKDEKSGKNKGKGSKNKKKAKEEEKSKEKDKDIEKSNKEHVDDVADDGKMPRVNAEQAEEGAEPKAAAEPPKPATPQNLSKSKESDKSQHSQTSLKNKKN